MNSNHQDHPNEPRDKDEEDLQELINLIDITLINVALIFTAFLLFLILVSIFHETATVWLLFLRGLSAVAKYLASIFKANKDTAKKLEFILEFYKSRLIDFLPQNRLLDFFSL